MVMLVTKNISGRKYTYAVKSVRLPDGTIKKFYKLVKGGAPDGKALKDYFLSKEKEANASFALSKFATGSVFTPEEISKLESMRIDYKYLINKLSKADIKDMLDRFVVNFTYDSNAIEGNSLTLKDVSIVIFENAAIKGKELREIYETRNSREVMDLVLRKKFAVTHDGIIRMHKMLMRDIDDRVGYKTVPNFIMGRNIKTAPPERVYQEMGDLIGVYNDSLGRVHPLEIASAFHGRFEKIHPFQDGNGRVGRFLVNAILVNSNYPPLIIRKTVRQSYMNSLSAFDNGYEDKLKRFLVEKYKETFRKFFGVYVKYV